MVKYEGFGPGDAESLPFRARPVGFGILADGYPTDNDAALNAPGYSDLHHDEKGKRLVRSIGLASLLLVTTGLAQADETLVLNLPAFPQQQQAVESAPAPREAA